MNKVRMNPCAIVPQKFSRRYFKALDRFSGRRTLYPVARHPLIWRPDFRIRCPPRTRHTTCRGVFLCLFGSFFLPLSPVRHPGFSPSRGEKAASGGILISYNLFIVRCLCCKKVKCPEKTPDLEGRVSVLRRGCDRADLWPIESKKKTLDTDMKNNIYTSANITGLDLIGA